MSSNILDAIDSALEDYATSGDAMRWNPDVGRVICDEGRPLWPERWDAGRPGKCRCAVTAVDYLNGEWIEAAEGPVYADTLSREILNPDYYYDDQADAYAYALSSWRARAGCAPGSVPVSLYTANPHEILRAWLEPAPTLWNAAGPELVPYADGTMVTFWHNETFPADPDAIRRQIASAYGFCAIEGDLHYHPPGPSPRCHQCQPAANPRRLPINGREYARRRSARKKR